MTSDAFNVSSAKAALKGLEAGRSILTWSVSLREQPASRGLYGEK